MRAVTTRAMRMNVADVSITGDHARSHRWSFRDHAGAHSAQCDHIDAGAHSAQCDHIDAGAHSAQCDHIDAGAHSAQCDHIDAGAHSVQCPPHYRINGSGLPHRHLHASAHTALYMSSSGVVAKACHAQTHSFTNQQTNPPCPHAQLQVDNNDGGKIDGGPNLCEVIWDAILIRGDHCVHGHKVARQCVPAALQQQGVARPCVRKENNSTACAQDFINKRLQVRHQRMPAALL
eukprot:scaffold57520_cov27-Tisochrysis_lutea.AAC.1